MAAREIFCHLNSFDAQIPFNEEMRQMVKNNNNTLTDGRRQKQAQQSLRAHYSL